MIQYNSNKKGTSMKNKSKRINPHKTLQTIMAISSTVLLLGLAVRGASTFITQITPEYKIGASVVVVVLLAYAIWTRLASK